MTAQSIDEVLDRLDSIVAQSERDGDRIGYFAALYRRFTAAVGRSSLATSRIASMTGAPTVWMGMGP